MILLIKKKGNYHRRFKMDIWGLCFLDEKNHVKKFRWSWIIRFFLKMYKKKINLWWKNRRRYIYRIDIIEFRERRKKWKKRWLTLRLTRLYFLTLQDYQFRKIFRQANKLSGNLNTNYCYFLECRTITLLYRSNFLVNIFHCIRFVKRKWLYVQKKPISYINATIPVGSVIFPYRRWKTWMRYHLFLRLTQRSILFNTPNFLFISFRLFFIFLMKKPVKKDLVYPISIDIQRISGYY